MAYFLTKNKYLFSFSFYDLILYFYLIDQNNPVFYLLKFALLLFVIMQIIFIPSVTYIFLIQIQRHFFAAIKGRRYFYFMHLFKKFVSHSYLIISRIYPNFIIFIVHSVTRRIQLKKLKSTSSIFAHTFLIEWICSTFALFILHAFAFGFNFVLWFLLYPLQICQDPL